MHIRAVINKCQVGGHHDLSPFYQMAGEESIRGCHHMKARVRFFCIEHFLWISYWRSGVLFKNWESLWSVCFMQSWLSANFKHSVHSVHAMTENDWVFIALASWFWKSFITDIKFSWIIHNACKLPWSGRWCIKEEDAFLNARNVCLCINYSFAFNCNSPCFEVIWLHLRLIVIALIYS